MFTIAIPFFWIIVVLQACYITSTSGRANGNERNIKTAHCQNSYTNR
jgi:hypothetical protein